MSIHPPWVCKGESVVSGMALSGSFLVDKPVGPTCRQLLDTLERRLRIGPLGHAGTLDPRASGLLLVLAGAARKLQDLLMSSEKCYRGVVRLGFTSATQDGEGPIEASERPVPALTKDAVEDVLTRFRGEIQQTPPAFSAVRVDGQRAWKLARAGKAPALKTRTVVIHSLTVEEMQSPDLTLEVVCSKGTYIRSLARDIGDTFGCGAYLHALRRLRSGRHDVTSARPADEIEVAHLTPLSEILTPWPRLDVDIGDATHLGHGRAIPAALPPGSEPAFAWYEGRPFCRLRTLADGRVRSDLRLGDLPSA